MELPSTAAQRLEVQPGIRLLEQPRNQGKGAAVRRAIAAATGELSVIHDADLEYNPDDWALLLQPFLESDADAVFGSRFASSEYRRVLYFWHTQLNRFLTLLSNLMTDLDLTDMENRRSKPAVPLVWARKTSVMRPVPSRESNTNSPKRSATSTSIRERARPDA
jgi:glycosyltransferase involved in cell wall biosynthesis